MTVRVHVWMDADGVCADDHLIFMLIRPIAPRQSRWSEGMRD